jgi:hypothetical protein
MLSISAIVRKRKERRKWDMIRDEAEYHKEVLKECDNVWKREEKDGRNMEIKKNKRWRKKLRKRRREK